MSARRKIFPIGVSARRNVFAEVSAYKNVSINVIGYFSAIFHSSGLLGEYAVWQRAREKVEDSQFSKDAKQGSTEPYSTSLPTKAECV
jgi:hypothetical protein